MRRESLESLFERRDAECGLDIYGGGSVRAKELQMHRVLHTNHELRVSKQNRCKMQSMPYLTPRRCFRLGSVSDNSGMWSRSVSGARAAA